MSNMEMVYLMQVSLYLPTLKDIMTFITINKKCQVAVTSLKVNPWFSKSDDIEKFCTFFSPDTVNCNSLIVSQKVLETAVYIRNVQIFSTDFNKLNDQNIAEKITSLIIVEPKPVDTFQQNNVNVENKFYEILYKWKIPNIEMSLKLFSECVTCFERNNNVNMNDTYFPKKVLLHVDSMCNDFYTDMSPLYRNINSAAKKYDSQINIDWTDTTEPEKVRLTPNCQNYTQEITPKIFQFIKPLYRKRLLVKIDGYDDDNYFKTVVDIFNKCYSTFVELKTFGDISKLSIPDFVKDLSISWYTNERHSVWLPCNMKIESLSISEIDLIFADVVPTVKTIKATNSTFVLQKVTQNDTTRDTYKEWEMDNNFPFPNVEEIELQKCLNINFKTPEHLTTLKVCENSKNIELFVGQNCEHLNIENVTKSSFCIDCNKLDTFIFKQCRNTIFEFINAKPNSLSLEFIECLTPTITVDKDTIKLFSLKKCTGVKMMNNIEMSNVIIENTKFNNSTKFTAKSVILNNITEFLPIDFTHTKFLRLFGLSRFSFNTIFENCEILEVSFCEHLNFVFQKEHLKNIKIESSHNLVFSGEFHNVECCVLVGRCSVKFPQNTKLPIENVEIKEESDSNEGMTISKFKELEMEYTEAQRYLTHQFNEPYGPILAQYDTTKLNKFISFLTQNVTLVVTKPICHFQNYVCQSLKIKTKITLLSSLSISNFIGKMIDLSGVLIGNLHVENCDDVDYSNRMFKYKEPISAVNVTINKYNGIRWIFSSITKHLEITNSLGDVKFTKANSQFESVVFRNCNFNRGVLFNKDLDMIQNLTIENTYLDYFFRNNCVGVLMEINNDNIRMGNSMLLVAKSANFDHCKNFKIRILKPNTLISIKNCSKFEINTKNPNNIDVTNSTEIDTSEKEKIQHEERQINYVNGFGQVTPQNNRGFNTFNGQKPLGIFGV
ncbi:hypothetical protein EIN_107310 [Entamoeba invadens IP1]|uniref:Uncharacterized protein n=1 Tax=Entamoeba invadens IP1 TaxID=370355 RepID=A0A0A1UD50_ENTIV|nr:hypothetical protein EIN_107310 [Entamoeba invadens IP1]ELP90232.1 hypothetical protein EIN_107310 [Entamoeba invadens IP1]|eukprot:XP_004257003.1 hypothetical protein EIN_107310 [Entamoeba invadens IP1]